MAIFEESETLTKSIVGRILPAGEEGERLITVV